MRSKRAWAVVYKGGVVDVESIRLRKSDVALTLYDEENAKVRRVVVTVVPE